MAFVVATGSNMPFKLLFETKEPTRRLLHSPASKYARCERGKTAFKNRCLAELWLAYAAA
eukprot:CAMPEP_0172891370 /NCGR_PEP_ID=MMETSP1075-20121228/143707_1 /TAXON_ID=2916 /ORGANISM="Ceratium fusus, Strain PA161109" /LENGTH=59 /DNA_ID=CAMNT_0013745823 /DNA_START=139 /DNA_END=314 /DNA_ORIENTATION=+